MMFRAHRKTPLEACQYVLEPEGDLCAPCYLKLSGKEYGIRVNPVQHQTSEDSSLTPHCNIRGPCIMRPDSHPAILDRHVKTLFYVSGLKEKGLPVYLPEPLPYGRVPLQFKCQKAPKPYALEALRYKFQRRYRCLCQYFGCFHLSP